MSPNDIALRVRTRLSLAEVFALGVSISLALYYTYLASQNLYFPYDLQNYLKAGQGDPSFYYYGYWMLPLFSALATLPVSIQLPLFFSANILATWWAARVFGGRPALAVLNYQLLYGVYYGQFTGIILAGLALFQWGLATRRWTLAGIGLLTACTKFQLGVPFAAALWLLSDAPWPGRLKALILPSIIGGLSLAFYPLWPLEVLQRILVTNPPNDWGSISLWRWIGPAALLLWLPTLLLPMSRERRLVMVIATTALAFPYFQQADLIALYILPVSWLSLLGNIGFLFVSHAWYALQAVVIVPLVAYVGMIMTTWLARWQTISGLSFISQILSYFNFRLASLVPLPKLTAADVDEPARR